MKINDWILRELPEIGMVSIGIIGGMIEMFTPTKHFNIDEDGTYLECLNKAIKWAENHATSDYR